MPSDVIEIKKDEACQVHGAPSRAANRTLLIMIAASLALIVWRVWVYGPSGHAAPETAHRSFPLLIGAEIWGLLFDRHGIVAELWDVFPYFIAGVLLAGYIRTYKIAVKLQAKLRQYGVASVFLASFVGIVTPLCACGTLTTAISLLFAGIPLAPVMALLVTSPLMSPSTYLITLNDLGPEWTVIRTVSAFAMGVFAGIVTHLLRDRGFRTETVFIEGAIPRGDFHDEAYPDERLRCNCKEKLGNRVAARTGNLFLVFLAKSAEMLWTVGKYILVGVAIGTIVERYVPFEWIYQLFGRKDPLNIVWITLGSVPLFLHQISASSILYHVKSSLAGTLDNGAALAFMIGGPVTAVPTMVLFWTVFKKRVFGLYLFICIAGTLLIAYTFQFLVFVPNVDTGNPLVKGVRTLSGGYSSVIQKQDKNVRIVMDPDGSGMIALSADELSQRGGIVFDASFDRMQIGNTERYDNAIYLGNVASWLEQNNSSQVKGRILIYHASARASAGKTVIGKNGISSLEQQGFSVRISGRRDLPQLSAALLEAYSQVWVLFGDAGQVLSDGELEALAGFMNSGKGMLIVAGPEGGGAWDPAAANRLASRYGVEFSRPVKHREELPATTASYFLQRTSGLLGSILKFFHKA
jgi:uncharacterized protein